MGLLNEENKCTKKEENRHWKTKLLTNLKGNDINQKISNCTLQKSTG